MPLLRFSDLVASRRDWIETVLIPWCHQAIRQDLLQAETEWTDLAGRPAPEMTLWLWAWGRFPVLVETGLTTISETRSVRVLRRDGRVVTGYPDARKSIAGELFVVQAGGEISSPISIDDIQSIDLE
ncbi:hypothetical protein SH668x_000672 [Planctomicrobium sp. SH668]|uniref:hypothetical protein n=1 Tax=Planctomicrobium sp. SH668 TaxID=3448126 RepID=UPI003F5C32CB